MTISEVTTHVAEAQDNVVEQFRGKTTLAALIESWVQQIQDLETAAFEVLEDTLLSTAVGVQLDGIGEVLNEERQGKSDADYRVALAAIINVRNSEATCEDLIELVDGATGGGATLLVREPVFPAYFEIEVDTPITNGEEVAAFVDRARAVAVAGYFQWFEAPLGTEFRFGVAGQGLDEGLLGQAIPLP